LPYIRTSVDHGTALTLAASGNASNSSLLEAIDMAIELSQHR
jgi:4-hydroxythreonine-4-phosphate dehydrogenase